MSVLVFFRPQRSGILLYKRIDVGVVPIHNLAVLRADRWSQLLPKEVDHAR